MFELPHAWALLIGDFAYNARAALDHLAWELAARFKWRESRARKAGKTWPPDNTEFPIVARIRDRDEAKRLKRKLSYFRPSDRKTVAAEQPYRRGKQAYSQPLWLLHRLRNTDAHRELHTVLASVPPGELGEWTSEVIPAPSWYSPDLPKYLEKFTWPGASGVTPIDVGDIHRTTLYVDANFAPFVTFDQPRADFHRQEVLPLLSRCRNEVERVLDCFPA